MTVLVEHRRRPPDAVAVPRRIVNANRARKIAPPAMFVNRL